MTQLTVLAKRCARMLRVVEILFALLALFTGIYLIYTVVIAAQPAQRFTIVARDGGLAVETPFSFTLSGSIPDGVIVNHPQSVVNPKAAHLCVLGVSLVFGLLPSLVLLYLLALLLRDTLRQGTPFAQRNVSRLRGMASCLLVSVLLLRPVLALLLAITATDGSFSLHLSLPLPLLVAGFLLFVLEEVFRYGACLQLEHDETL